METLFFLSALIFFLLSLCILVISFSFACVHYLLLFNLSITPLLTYIIEFHKNTVKSKRKKNCNTKCLCDLGSAQNNKEPFSKAVKQPSFPFWQTGISSV
ncbi:hypothetical protein DM01DRAFT_1037353 [Hesseltinella vesiculosa]|uniref:Uncharacterized protein n=1 Tax=Hesseltinella vesiculosa TaxID=101127 RepID=A0A1X2GIR0_9FUNG|nr:hypothetical protein DM01DRAFT_1037353 [Hesseltinella vesiculosa]